MAPSKMVLDRKKSADAVIAAARTHEARVASALKTLLGAGTDDATSTFLLASAKALEERSKALLSADENHNLELSDDTGARALRDEHAAALRDKLIKDREMLAGIAGDDYVAQLGFKGPTPDQPDAVLALGRVVEKRMTDLAAPKSRLPDYQFDAAKWAKSYEPLVAQLDKSLERVRADVRESEATQVDKNRALQEFDRVFSAAASFVSALLSMGGEEELARRVRPSNRKVGLTAEVADDPVVPAVVPVDVPVPA